MVFVLELFNWILALLSNGSSDPAEERQDPGSGWSCFIWSSFDLKSAQISSYRSGRWVCGRTITDFRGSMSSSKHVEIISAIGSTGLLKTTRQLGALWSSCQAWIAFANPDCTSWTRLKWGGNRWMFFTNLFLMGWGNSTGVISPDFFSNSPTSDEAVDRFVFSHLFNFWIKSFIDNIHIKKLWMNICYWLDSTMTEEKPRRFSHLDLL